MYHFKNAITHPSSLIADKANFFADYFEFVAADLGKVGALELENHKSLLEKVFTQLENHTQHSKQYVNHYFTNPYLSKKDPLIKKYYLDDWKLVKAAWKKYNKSTEPNDLQATLKLFVEKLDQSLFKNALNEIIAAIQCKHPLGKHDHVNIFEYNTPIIVSEFVFAGFDHTDLYLVFKNIFTKEIRLDGDKVRTQAPLPPELIELKHDATKFYHAASAYLNKRNLKQQFEGIYFLFKNSVKNRTFIFRLRNVQTYGTL